MYMLIILTFTPKMCNPNIISMFFSKCLMKLSYKVLKPVLKVMARCTCCMSLCFDFNICASINVLSLWISIEKQLHNMHNLTAVSTADLVTCIKHLAFWFYKYRQNSRSSVVSSITPNRLSPFCYDFDKNDNKTHIRTWLSHKICLQNKISSKSQNRLRMRSWEIKHVELYI